MRRREGEDGRCEYRGLVPVVFLDLFIIPRRAEEAKKAEEPMQLLVQGLGARTLGVGGLSG